MSRSVFAGSLLLVLAACGGDDGGCPECVDDAGGIDGGTLDSGVDLGARSDAGSDQDGGASDAGVPTDAFVATDAFVEPDAFVATDAFVEPDAFMEPDGGMGWTACAGGTGDHTVVTGVQPGLPRVLWTGSDYAIGHFRKPTAGLPARESYVGRVDAMGTVTSVPTMVTPDDGELSIWVRLARSATGFGVIYLDDRGATRQAYFARLDDTGALVAGSELHLSDAADTIYVHAIAYNPIDREYGVSWVNADSEIHFARISEAGVLLPAPGSTSVVDDGDYGYTGTPLIWADDHYAIVSTPFGVTEIAANGMVTRSGDIEAGTVLNRPAIAWSGTEYGVVWRQPSDQSIRFTRVDATGRVSGSERTLHPGPWAGEPDIVWADTNEWGVVWNVGSASDPYDIHFARLAPDGTTRANSAVVSGPVTDWWPQLTWCGQYAIVYQHGQTGVDEVGELHLFFP
ncbi:MAG: hypothetical protein JJ863_00580 [Deltaproteobacteria bacterium]|nr:hypothetical protein [Deltaproteobacteria bacterium]